VRLNMCRVVVKGSILDYIRFIVKLVTTTCIRAAIVGANSAHIRFEVITIVKCDHIVIVIRTKCNPSINNYIIVNREIRRATTHFVYNRELDNDFIWTKHRINCSTDRADYNINRANCSINF